MKGRPGKHPPPPVPSPPGPAHKIKDAFPRKPSARMARERLVVEMYRLRSLFAEIAQRYTADTEARIAALITTAESKTIPPTKVSEMLDSVGSVDVKPRKGRRKDLARIEKVVDALERSLNE